MTWHRITTWVLGATLALLSLPACAPAGGSNGAPPPADTNGDGGGSTVTGKQVTFLGSRRAGDTAFEFRTSAEEAVSLRVLLDDEPLVGARVSIVDPLPEPGPGELPEDMVTGGAYFQGQTDARGRLTTTVKVPTELTTLDVIIDHVGASGPYTSTYYRDLWGPMGPSSRTNHSRDRLQGLTIRLTTTP